MQICRYSLLISQQRKFRCLQLATDNPMLTTSNGYSVAEYIIFIKLIFIYLLK